MIQEPDDDLLPLRAVNAHAFCPRLAWLEYRAAEFAHNAHTLEGAFAHRHISRGGGKLPAAEAVGDDEQFDAREVWLGSASLGVQGKLDVVEAAGEGTVMPVDTKKGRARDDGALWPADEVQLVLQALLLREEGYRVEEVAAYYRASRRRVRSSLTAARVATARAAVEATRATLADELPPPPLEDSPKCGGCSLSAICQPDEVSFLQAQRPEEPPRRVVPPPVERQPLYVTEPRARVGVSRDNLVVKSVLDDAEQKHVAGLARTSQLVVVGNAQLSTQALRRCLRAGVPVAFLSGGGWLDGVAVGDESRAVHVRIAQHSAKDRGREIANRLIADKIANQRTLLRRNDDELGAEAPVLKRLRQLTVGAERSPSPQQLLAREGEAAKRYWDRYAKMVAAGGFEMKGRTRRPPRDPINSMISFASGLLTKDAVLAARLAGLDAYLGVFHTPHHGRPSMALDLMEPFRPLIVDSIVLSLARRGEVTAEGFLQLGAAVSMRPDTRKRLVNAYERRLAEQIRHPVFGYRISYRQVLAVHARLIARVLTGEIDSLPPFRTR